MYLIRSAQSRLLFRTWNFLDAPRGLLTAHAFAVCVIRCRRTASPPVGVQQTRRPGRSTLRKTRRNIRITVRKKSSGTTDNGTSWFSTDVVRISKRNPHSNGMRFKYVFSGGVWKQSYGKRKWLNRKRSSMILNTTVKNEYTAIYLSLIVINIGSGILS